AEDGIREATVTRVHTCALPISGERIGNEQAGRQQHAELALRPAEKLNDGTGYGPREELPADIGRSPSLDCRDVDPVHGRDEPLRSEGRRVGKEWRRARRKWCDE